MFSTQRVFEWKNVNKMVLWLFRHHEGIRNPYFQVADIEKLRQLVSKTEKQIGDKTIYLIADMYVFNHTKKASELLEYEKTLHKDLKVKRWKELCLYNKRDFEIMFTKNESKGYWIIIKIELF